MTFNPKDSHTLWLRQGRHKVSFERLKCQASLLIQGLGKSAATKMDKFSEKFQTAVKYILNNNVKENFPI